MIGWAAIAFAIVTVIFTPLSFMTSLMALPISQFLDHQHKYHEDGKAYIVGYIASIFGKSPYNISTSYANGQQLGLKSPLWSLVILGAVYWLSPMNRRPGKKSTTGDKPKVQANDGFGKDKSKMPADGEIADGSSEVKAKSTGWMKTGIRDSLTRRFKRKKMDEEVGGADRQVEEEGQK